MTPGSAAQLRRARIAVSALFLVNGAFIANVLPRLPLIKDGLGLSNAELGSAVAAMPIGSLIAGAVSGWLIVRIGARPLVVGAGAAFGLLLVSIALAPSWPILALSFLVLGCLDAVMDAAMNVLGIALQAGYGRSILHGFHGWWSVGALVGGAVGAIAAGASVPIPLHLAVAGAALAAVSVASWLALLPEAGVDRRPRDTARGHLGNAGWILRRIGPIALLGVLGVMLEDAAQTWSSIYLVDVLRQGVALGAAAFVVYMLGMTVGRLTNDRWVDRFGPLRLARIGALGAALGLGLVIAAGMLRIPGLAFAGFAVVGVGASPLFPVMIVAAGGVPSLGSAYGVATASWLARVGFVLAPALVGFAADRAGLATAFWIPVLAALAIAVLARFLLAPWSGARPGGS